MPRSALAMEIDKDEVVARAQGERRRFRRVAIEIRGKIFTPGDGQEADCRVVDISPGGAQVACDLSVAAGTAIILYADGFGRFEGVVARPVDGAEQTGTLFGIKFICSALKRERVAEQLTMYMNKGLVDDPAAIRRHDREPTKGVARFTRANGDIVSCEVLDLSLSGVSVKSEIRPPLGEVVLIGQMAGRVVRQHDNGVGIEFIGTPNERGTAERIHARLSVVR